MTDELPRALAFRITQLRALKDKPAFHRYSAQLLLWLQDDPVYGPLARQMVQELVELNQQFERQLQNHLVEAGELIPEVRAFVEETAPSEGWQGSHGLPSMKYMFSLQRAEDIAAGRDLMANAQPLEGPKFMEDRTAAGQLIDILWNTVTTYGQEHEGLWQDDTFEQLYLKIDYLVARQNELLARIQIQSPALPGNAIRTLAECASALIPKAQRHASLRDRGNAFMAVPAQSLPNLVAIQRESREEVPPNESLREKVVALWDLVFQELAERLERPKADRDKPLLERTRLLVISANTQTEPLWIEKESQAIRDTLWNAQDRTAITPYYRSHATGAQVLPELDQVRPHIVHFSAHGTPEAVMLIHPNDANQTTPYDASYILKELELAMGLRLAVFMTCESADIAEQAVQHIDAAIGMREKVPDEDAPIFSRALYGALAKNLSLQAAFDRACHAVQVEGEEPELPVLFVRDGVNAEEMRFGQFG